MSTSIDSRVLRRKRWHQWLFIAAGLYNIAWGIYAALDPQWLFRFAGMPPLNHPQIFACLGMVIGLYGVIYLEVARRPETGWLLAAIGFVGKILGPIGLFVLISNGTWPPATLVLCVTNDIIWWIPFGLYLWDAWPFFRSSLEQRRKRTGHSQEADCLRSSRHRARRYRW